MFKIKEGTHGPVSHSKRKGEMEATVFRRLFNLLNSTCLTSNECTDISRRRFINGAIGAAGLSILGPLTMQGCGGRWPRTRRPIRTKYETIAHEILDIELEHVNSKTAYEVLDEIIDISRHMLYSEEIVSYQNPKIAYNTLKTIDNTLSFHGFSYKKNSLLATALTTKGIDCDGYSALYLAIGETLNLPIKMVRAPAHTFVRWEFRDGTYVNWETTIGAPKSDRYYVIKHKIDRKANGVTSLKSLDITEDRDEILANTYVNCGVEWLKKLQFDKAIDRFDEAIRRDPLYEAPYYNKGLVYFHRGDMENAIKWCEKAVSLNPNHMKSHAVLGTAYKELNDAARAKIHFRRVRELDPEYYTSKIMEMQLSDTNVSPLGNTAIF